MDDFLSTLEAEVALRRLSLLEHLRAQPSGAAWCRLHTSLADSVWRSLYAEMVSRFPECPPVAILATGGYGRQEMSPHSDIDVSLVPLAEGPILDSAVRWVFKAADQIVRSSLGLRLAYVYRLPADVPGLDPVTLSNLLDMRLVAGSPEPSRRLEEALWIDLPSAEFVLHKIEERHRDMATTHTTPLVVEPNLKLGAGGLRCFHSLNWIGQAIGERAKPTTQDVDYLLQIRNLLHLVSDRQNDNLTRLRRQEISEVLGIDSRELGSQVAESMVSNHDEYLLGLRRIHESRFFIGSVGRAVRGELRIEPGCPADQAAVAVDIATRLGLIVPENEAAVTDPTSPLALTALTGEATIRNLARSGVMRKLIPELAACQTLMPSDESHRYTVYEHTLVAIRYLEKLDTNTALGQINLQIASPECLVLAILLHDVGKADSQRHHSESGAEMARKICDLWRMDQNRADLVVWLVREHLLMSKFIRMRDVMQPDTAKEFAEIVGSEQKLHMLTVLTYVDVNAVAPDLWTPVQEQFLLELYARTLSILRSQSDSPIDESSVRRQILRKLKKSDIPQEKMEVFLNSLPAHYVLSTDSETAAVHFGFMQQAISGQTVVSFHHQHALGVSEITVCNIDIPGALTGILGVLYAFDLTLVALRASTTSTHPPVLLDTFVVSASKRPLSDKLAQKISHAIEDVLNGQSVDEILRTHGKDPDRQQEFLNISLVDQKPAIIEVRAPRGRGLAYRLARVIAGQRLNIVAARVGQWAASGSAAFYVLPEAGEHVDLEALKAAFRS